MLLLVDWFGDEHNETGIAFARHCKQTLLGMTKEKGV